MFNRLLLVVGAVLLVLFSASIVGSLAAPTDERCDNCLKTMKMMYALDMHSCDIYAYQCECGQRGQKTYWDDGRVEWQEW
ncbi:MAG: hypothetical protein JNG89_00685 [Planctomycetaceae bacterium]|nr:hypothetical protein [Planctomycetaceae bacterium]